MSASSPPDATAPGKSCGTGTIDEGIPKELEGIFDIIEQSKGQMLAWLKDLVAIPSVSAEKEHRKDIMRVIKETNRILLEQDVHVTTVPLGDQQLPDGSKLPLPPLLLGATRQEPGKNTLCVYGHLDVYPARKEDGWTADPFLPTEKDGRLFARGVAHDKGPLVAWIGALYAYRQSAAKASPVNLKFLVESMEDVGSLGLGPYLAASAKQNFFKGINFVCIPNGFWLSPLTPSISYGLRGLCSFSVEIAAARSDHDSGVDGGTLNEAMADLVHLLDSLMGTRGRIAVDGIHDDVAPISDSEWKLYEHVDFDPDEYQAKHGIWHVTIDDTVQLLMRRWRYPSLTIHGIEGAHWSPGENAVIPSRVVGKFSVRTVPNQTCQKVRDCVTSHLEREFAKRNSPNKFKVTMTQGTETWFNEPQRPHIKAAAAAVRHSEAVRSVHVRTVQTLLSNPVPQSRHRLHDGNPPTNRYKAREIRCRHFGARTTGGILCRAIANQNLTRWYFARRRIFFFVCLLRTFTIRKL
ncbi:cytosolic non-specific dipeptidase-like isoform X1 [Dermacentor andersoni]|uniref:cytosolic non-specific dipeptidase-like isoform X1 n=1 Tax=Dermacentor andersoni TaxID=34620 RepID=UPI003B3AC1DF